MQQVMLDAQFKAGQAYLMLAGMTDKLLPFVEGAPMKIQAFWHRSHCAEWWEEKVRCLHWNGCMCYQHNKRACIVWQSLNLVTQNISTCIWKITSLFLQKTWICNDLFLCCSQTLFSLQNQTKIAQVQKCLGTWRKLCYPLIFFLLHCRVNQDSYLYSSFQTGNPFHSHVSLIERVGL